jgi:FkbM family methyltransferase
MTRPRALWRRAFDALPLWLRKLAGHSRAIVRRLRIWSEVATHLSGVGEADRVILRRAITGAPIDVFREINVWRDPAVASDCRVAAKGIGTFHVRAHSDDLYHVLPTRERAVIEGIRNRLQTGDCFVDAGANIGIYSVLGSQLVGPPGRVIAIEMMPDTAAILRSHLVANRADNVTVVEGALAARPGERVVAHIPNGKFGQASIATRKGERTVEVETTTLAQILEGIGRVRLIKMDLEGAELDALKGAEPVLDRVEAILFEDWGQAAISAYLVGRGYSVEPLDRRNSLAVRR